MLPDNKTLTKISTTEIQIDEVYKIECAPFSPYLYLYKEDLEAFTKVFPCEECKKKEDVIESLKKENELLKRNNSYYKEELNRLHTELIKRTRKVPLVSFEDILLEHTENPTNRARIDKARAERQKEWLEMVKAGKMSKIKYYRMLKGMDQITFAKKLGMAQPNVSRLERPGYNVPVKTLAKIAKILKVSLEELVE